MPGNGSGLTGASGLQAESLRAPLMDLEDNFPQALSIFGQGVLHFRRYLGVNPPFEYTVGLQLPELPRQDVLGDSRHGSLQFAETVGPLHQVIEDNVLPFTADLSLMSDVKKLATTVAAGHQRLDVLINNTGIYVTPQRCTAEGLDYRFAVNSIAPYLLTRRLLPLMEKGGRLVNLSYAAQSPVKSRSLAAPSASPDGAVYAMNK